MYSKTVVIFSVMFFGFAVIREFIMPGGGFVIDWANEFGASSLIGLYFLLGILVAIVARNLARQADKEKERIISDLEEKLIRDEPLHNAGLMAAGLAHNFRNYLGIIGGTSTMLSKVKEANALVKRAVEIQNKALLQADGLLDQLMVMVKNESHERNITRPLNEVLDESVDLAEVLVKVRDIDIKRDYGSLEIIEINDLSLMQSVINLVKNAAEASKSGSTIKVSARRVETSTLPRVEVSVSDTGEGMSEEMVKKVFSPFHSTKRSRGVGLGLVSVKRLVEQDGGEVRIVSQKNKGTEVTISYPTVRALSGALSVKKVMSSDTH